MTPSEHAQPATGDPASLEILPAGPGDAGLLADLYLRSRRAAYPAMPPPVHDDGAVRAEMRAAVEAAVAGTSATEVYAAWRAGAPAGYLRLDADWLHSLYVEPRLAGQGVGTALLDLAKSVRPGGFSLWVFETNLAAQRFYDTRGLVRLESTDGEDNEERSPDLRMAWPGVDAVGFLRSEVDRVDRELARLLARRCALTAALQPVKPVSGRRDPDREEQIVRAMATEAPAVGEHRLRRIMDVVITASLEAAGYPPAVQGPGDG